MSRYHVSSRHSIHTEHDHCFGCGSNISTPNHELGCVLGYGDQVKARHNLICRVIVEDLNRIGDIARLEPRPFRNNSQRPDIEWLIDGKRFFFNVAAVRARRLNNSLLRQRRRRKRMTFNSTNVKISRPSSSHLYLSYGGYGKQFKTFITDLTCSPQPHTHRWIRYHQHIAYHIFCLNGLIMKLASTEHENYVTRVVSSTA